MNLVIKPRYRPVPEIRVKGTGEMITLGPQHIIFNLIPDVTLEHDRLSLFGQLTARNRTAGRTPAIFEFRSQCSVSNPSNSKA